MTEDQDNFKKMMMERFNELPPAIQEAMLDANIEDRLREVSKKYKLHYDKWILLENQIMLTLLNMQSPEQLPQHISEATGLNAQDAQELSDTIVREIYNPIQEELYDTLNNKKERAIKTLTKKEEIKEPEAPSQSYHNTTLTSTNRKEIENDPYRESILS